MNGLYNLGRNKSPWDLEKPFSLSGYSPNMAERGTFDFSDMKPLTELTEPDMAPTTPETTPINPLLGTTSPETKKPTSLLDYWKQPVFGKIPLDQFVRLAGLLGHAIAPETPMGRAGGVLGQMGSQAYAERMKREEEELKYKREEPRKLLEMQKLQAEIKKLGELKKPTPHYEPTIQNGMFGQYDVNNKTFVPVRPATEEDKRKIEMGKEENKPSEIQIYEYDMKQRKDSGLTPISINEWKQEQDELKANLQKANMNIHYETDDKGITTKIVSDSRTGKTVSKETIGKIGKEKTATEATGNVEYQRKYTRGYELIKNSFFKLDPLGNAISMIEGKSEDEYLGTMNRFKQNIDKGVDEIQAATQALKVSKAPKPPSSKPTKEGRYNWEGHEWNWTKKEGWILTK